MADINLISTWVEFEQVAALAREIWLEHYVPLVSREQIEYMLERFQSAAAIASQIEEGGRYFMLRDAESPAGYFAIFNCKREMKLSKLYLRSAYRSRGYGRAMIDFVVERCLAEGLENISLTVNRHNAGSIAFYERVGFYNAGPIVQEIGGGFVMDDYKMVLPIK